jgi:hypothetical protein
MKTRHVLSVAIPTAASAAALTLIHVDALLALNAAFSGKLWFVAMASILLLAVGAAELPARCNDATRLRQAGQTGMAAVPGAPHQRGVARPVAVPDKRRRHAQVVARTRKPAKECLELVA